MTADLQCVSKPLLAGIVFLLEKAVYCQLW